MTDQELEQFEQQLRRSQPAKPPELFAARLLSAEPKAEVVPELPASSSIPDYLRRLRQSLSWFIPATAVVLIAALAWRGNLPSDQPSPSSPAGTTIPTVLTANDVKIDQQLVSSFDAVARLPGGEPVRFRCENWVDQVVLSDKTHGVIAENRQPRFEVVALGFETY